MKFLEKMKVGRRLLLAGIAVFIGLLLVAGYTLFQIRNNALAAHDARLKDLVSTARGIVSNYQTLEANKLLTRDIAQTQAKEALRTLRYGNDDYFFVYDFEGRALMVAGNPKIEGTVLLGKTDAGGFKLWDALVASGKAGQGYIDYVFPRAGQTIAKPKRSYVVGVPDWQWVVGTGVYVDDVDEAVQRAALNFAAMSALVLLVLAAISVYVARSIVGQLGGEPMDAAEKMWKIANGNINIDIPVKEGDNASLMASLKVMQMKLLNITSSIADNSTALADQVKSFDSVSKRYSESKTVEDFLALQKSVAKLGKVADVLNKSIARFKL